MFVCVCVRASMCVCVSICVSVFVCVREYMYECECVCVREYMCECVCVCVCMYVCTCVYVCIYVCMHICYFLGLASQSPNFQGSSTTHGRVIYDPRSGRLSKSFSIFTSVYPFYEQSNYRC